MIGNNAVLEKDLELSDLYADLKKKEMYGFPFKKGFQTIKNK
jgi:hypothetical protein